jgi:hypothetical protein
MAASVISACSGGSNRAAAPKTATTSPRTPRAAAPLSAHVDLPSKTIAAGSTVNAIVVVENNTGTDLNVIGCGSPFAVALRNARIEPEVAWHLCRQTLTIPVGTSSHTLRVSASYLACGSGGRLPACVDGHSPPLPPGRYEATLYQHPIVVPTPAPIAVEVTP